MHIAVMNLVGHEETILSIEPYALRSISQIKSFTNAVSNISLVKYMNIPLRNKNCNKV